VLTTEQKEQVISVVREGGTLKAAAARINKGELALRRERFADPKFDKALVDASGGKLAPAQLDCPGSDCGKPSTYSIKLCRREPCREAETRRKLSKPANASEQYLTRNEVATMAGVPISVVNKWERNGLITAIVEGGHKMFRRAEVEEFVRHLHAIATPVLARLRRVLTALRLDLEQRMNELDGVEASLLGLDQQEGAR